MSRAQDNRSYREALAFYKKTGKAIRYGSRKQKVEAKRARKQEGAA